MSTTPLLREIFGRALDLAPNERPGYVESACGEDARLARDVLELLECHANLAGFLESRPDIHADTLPGSPLFGEAERWGGTAPPGEGTVIAGRYRLGPAIGEGGSAVVFRATDSIDGRTVAVKLGKLEGHHLGTLREEVVALRLLRLPGVVQLLDEGTDHGRHFIVTDLIEGDRFPGRSTPCSWDDACEVTLSLLEALARIHWAGLVHRDLKPANVLVDTAGRATILDLGLARDPKEEREGARLVGTLAYLAPEQLRGEPATVRSDLHAVGLMLYEALAGQHAHRAASQEELLLRRAEAPAPSLEASTPRAPAPVVKVVDALLERHPRDRPSSVSEVLAALGDEGRSVSSASPALRTLTSEPAAGALTQEQLAPLFAGPDRLLHLREDASRALWQRTGGARHRVGAEVSAWVRAGLARWEEGKLVTSRTSLSRLDCVAGSLASELPAGRARPASRERELLLLHAWAAGGAVRVASLAVALGRRRRDAEDDAIALVRDGWLQRLPDDRVIALAVPPDLEERCGSSRSEAASRLADQLSPGDDGRLMALAAAERLREAAEEALAISARRLHASDLNGTTASLTEGLRLARAERLVELEVDLLEELLETSLDQNTVQALDQALYEIGRSLPVSPRLHELEILGKAALLAAQGDAERSLGTLRALDSDLPPRLEKWCWTIRLVAGHAGSLEQESELLSEALTWVEARGDDPALTASAHAWQGWLRYRERRFDEAAHHHALSASGIRLSHARVDARLAGASASMEAGDFRGARQLAAQALEEARRHRLIEREARAEWLQRAIDYRQAKPSKPDHELVDAMTHVGGNIEALCCLTEAAIAWRGLQHETARELAGRAAALWGRLANPWGRLLARSLAIAAGEHGTEGALNALQEDAERCPLPDIALQALALLAEGKPERRDALGRSARRLDEASLRAERDVRLEVLSIEESLRILFTN